MRLLVTCNRVKLSGRMDLNMLYHLEALSEHADVLFVGEGWGSLDVLGAVGSFRPDLVYYAGDAGGCDFSSAPLVGLPKAVYMEDYWADLEERLEVLEQGNFDFLVTKNAPCVDFYLGRFSKLKHILNPHGYNPDVFHYDSVEKEWDFTVCGRIDERYRLRSRVLGLVPELRSRGYVVYVKPHPGYWDRGEVRVDDGQVTLNDVCNRSKVVLAGTGTGNQCHMAKIWEISATSAVCFTDVNSLDGDFQRIKSHVWYCDINWDNDRILSEIGCAIDNWNASKFYSLFVKYATISERAKQLVNSFRGVLGL